MAQKDKELLLKDLCARLPYGVKVHATVIDTDTNTEVEKVGVLSMIDTDTVVAFTSDDTNCYFYVTIHEIRPYLLPLSSMTEEQYEKFIIISGWDGDIEDIRRGKFSCIGYIGLDYIYDTIDWFNENHFDYRGLIPAGAAIDATGLNIY